MSQEILNDIELLKIMMRDMGAASEYRHRIYQIPKIDSLNSGF